MEVAQASLDLRIGLPKFILKRLCDCHLSPFDACHMVCFWDFHLSPLEWRPVRRPDSHSSAVWTWSSHVTPLGLSFIFWVDGAILTDLVMRSRPLKTKWPNNTCPHAFMVIRCYVKVEWYHLGMNKAIFPLCLWKIIYWSSLESFP